MSRSAAAAAALLHRVSSGSADGSHHTAGQAGDRLDGEDSPSTCFPIARSAGGPAVRVPLCRVTIPAESVPRSSATPPRSSRAADGAAEAAYVEGEAHE